MARAGAKLVLGARSEDGLSALVSQIKAEGGEAIYRATDVRKREDLQDFVALARSTYGRLDVLFSNAGTMPIGLMDELAVDDWETMVDVNVKGILFGIAAALPIFREQGTGHFIHTASTAARKTVPSQVVYSATKAAVLAISDGLGQELAGVIRVSTIVPGFAHTGFADHVKAPKLQEQLRTAGTKFAMSPRRGRCRRLCHRATGGVNVGEVTVRSSAQP